MSKIIQFPQPKTLEDIFLESLTEQQATLFGEIMENIMQDFITQVQINNELIEENKKLKILLKQKGNSNGKNKAEI